MPNWSDFLPDVPYTGAFGTGTPQEEATRAPTPVDKAVGRAGKIALMPGRAYNSQTPIPTDQMVGPATDLASFVTLGSGAMPAEANSLRMGIKAYHGSPHDFDRFDLSQVGTGEGAQAYGHGLYFAENPKVAEEYQKTLSAANNTDSARSILDRFKGDGAKAAEWARQQAPSGTPLGNYYEGLAQKFESGAPLKGRMYEVDINADPAHFLDWDKPLNQMSPAVQQKLQEAWLAHPSLNQYGSDIYRAAQDQAAFNSGRVGSGSSPSAFKPFEEQASKSLRDAGIPGIKYLDQGSRGAGEGSRNYVVFDDNLIDILRKYGWAGLAALPALQSREERT